MKRKIIKENFDKSMNLSMPRNFVFFFYSREDEEILAFYTKREDIHIIAS
jgi:hypothetical protein